MLVDSPPAAAAAHPGLQNILDAANEARAEPSEQEQFTEAVVIEAPPTSQSTSLDDVPVPVKETRAKETETGTSPSSTTIWLHK